MKLDSMKPENMKQEPAVFGERILRLIVDET